jgi:hypothetical protein
MLTAFVPCAVYMQRAPHRPEVCAVQEWFPPNGRGHCAAQHLAQRVYQFLERHHLSPTC